MTIKFLLMWFQKFREIACSLLKKHSYSFNAISTKIGSDLHIVLTHVALSLLTDLTYGFHKTDDQTPIDFH